VLPGRTVRERRADERPCFADRIDAPLEVDGLGSITVDVAFGGMWHAIADAAALGFALEPAEARELSRVGELIRVAAREQLPCEHPDNPDIAGVSIVQIAESWRGIGAVSRNAVAVAPGRLDRSATGTGLSARMAAMHARGLMRAGDGMTHASVIGSTFDGRIVLETAVGGIRERPLGGQKPPKDSFAATVPADCQERHTRTTGPRF
jgi:trans-L-3-hydroxyproline dehydratase